MKSLDICLNYKFYKSFIKEFEIFPKISEINIKRK